VPRVGATNLLHCFRDEIADLGGAVAHLAGSQALHLLARDLDHGGLDGLGGFGLAEEVVAGSEPLIFTVLILNLPLVALFPIQQAGNMAQGTHA